MTEPTVASAVLQDDGRYLITLDDGKTYYGPVGAGAPMTVSVTIPPVTLDPTGLATDTGQATGNADLASIATNTTDLATAAKQDTGNTALASVVTNTTGLAKESGGNLAALVAASQPISVSGTLAAVDDAVILALDGREGASFTITDIGGEYLGILDAFFSMDGGATWIQTNFWDGNSGGWWVQLVDWFAVLVGDGYDLYFPTAATHVKVHLTDHGGTPPFAIAVSLHAAAHSAAPDVAYVLNGDHFGNPFPVVGGIDSNFNAWAFKLGPDHSLKTMPGEGPAQHAASTITIASGVGSLAARSRRTRAILYCPASNAADVLLEGVMPIPKGVWTPIEAVDAIAITGTNGDVMQVVEVYN